MPERHTARGWWLEDAGPPAPIPATPPPARADVLIAGGGYTGMWAAWHIKRLEPGASVVVCDAGTCGEGPSGRNGGFVNDLWIDLPKMRQAFGDPSALDLARAAEEAVSGIQTFCTEQEVDAWFRRVGYLRVATTAGHDSGPFFKAADACQAVGVPQACHRVDAAQVASRCASPLFRSGVLFPGGATVHPGRLARGLRSGLAAAGVTLLEGEPLRRVRGGGSDLRAVTPKREIRAGALVLAAGPRLAGMRPLRGRLTVTSSHMVMTEPVPDILEELGWTGGEAITDMRTMVHYMRTTPDGRIAFGWGGGRVVFGARTGGRAELDPGVVALVEDDLRRFFPQLAGRHVAAGWGGPIDVSPTHLPVVGTVPGRPISFGGGYTGNGVGPSFLIGRTLASLALERTDRHSRLAFVDREVPRVPPEPLRFAGGTVVRSALLRKEAAEERGERPGRISAFVAGIPERLGIHIGR
jgi:glycine/D-amino acid oxidase-like deaminating enzyme